jgi:hypothetical protein
MRTPAAFAVLLSLLSACVSAPSPSDSSVGTPVNPDATGQVIQLHPVGDLVASDTDSRAMDALVSDLRSRFASGRDGVAPPIQIAAHGDRVVVAAPDVQRSVVAYLERLRQKGPRKSI